MPHRVGPKGQVVIAKEIRDRLGVEPGWLALQRLADDHVEIYFLPPEHHRSLKASLAPHIKGRLAASRAWTRARDAAWHEAAVEKVAARES